VRLDRELTLLWAMLTRVGVLRNPDCEIIKKTEASRAVSGCLLPFDLQNGWFRYDTLHLQLTDYRLGVP